MNLLTQDSSLIADVITVVHRWRVVHLLGIQALRARYARSRFGQLWLTLSNGLYILAAGCVWALIWHVSVDAYLPYVGAGLILYQFISGSIAESTSIIVSDARLYVNDRTPFLISTAAHVYRNIIVLLHNIPTILIIVFWSTSARFDLDWTYPFAVILVISFISAACYSLSFVCARFRDLAQIVNIVMQVSFLVTPVMWQIELVPPEYRKFFFLNPLTAALDLLRNPVVGAPVYHLAWPSMLIWTAIAIVFAMLSHRRFHRKIVFWI